MGESEVCEYLYMLTYIHVSILHWKLGVVIVDTIMYIIKEAVHFLILNYSAFLSD